MYKLFMTGNEGFETRPFSYYFLYSSQPFSQQIKIFIIFSPSCVDYSWFCSIDVILI